MNSKYKFLISNTMIFAVGNIMVKLISFFLMPLYTSILTTAEYGTAELLNNTVEIIFPIATLCIIEALYRFSIDEKEHSILFTNAAVIVFIGDLFVVLACYILYNIINYEYTIYFCILFLCTTFYKLTTQFARGLGHVKRFVFYGIINSILLVLSNIILLSIFNTGIEGYLISFSIGYGIAGIIAFVLSKEYIYINIKCFSRIKLNQMIKYSLPSIPNMLSWWVNSLSDRYIVMWFWGSEITGIYTASSKLPAIINLVSAIFQQAWQYSTAKEINNKSSNAFFLNIYKAYSLICFISCILIIIANKMICRVLLQANFYSAWIYVPLLVLAATFGCISTYFGTFYNAIKNNRMLMISTIIGAVFNTLLNLILIPKIGAMGAVIATAISYFIIMIIRINDVEKIIKIQINKKKLYIQVLILTISALSGCFDGMIFEIISVFALICLLITEKEEIKEIYSIMSRNIKSKYKNIIDNKKISK